jgi:sugar (pentulose or hexulose) kinase
LTKVFEYEQNREMTPRMLVGLGIDVGTTNTKVVAVDVAGERLPILALRSEPTPSAGDALLSVVRRLLGEVAAEAGPPIAIGVASMAETGLLLDREGAPATPLIRWNSIAPEHGPSRIIEELGSDEFGRLTGLPVLPKVPLLVCERLRRSTTDVWDPAARWSGIADLVALALTGELVTDQTLAARTGAVTTPGEFDVGLLERVGMSADRLPRIVSDGAAVGTVRTSTARALGIPSGTPVFVAGHDHAVGAWAAGVRGPGQVADSLGTAEAIVRVVGSPVDRIAVTRAGMTVGPTVEGGGEAIIAGAAGAGAMVGAWSGELDLAAAGLLERRPTGVLVLPYPFGRQAPSPDLDARVRVIGNAESPALRTRALFEGLALHARWMYEEGRALAHDRESGPVRILGGAGGSNALWLSVKGAVLPVPAVRVASPEPVAVGAAMLAAARAGATLAGGLPGEALDAPDASYEPIYRDFVAAARQKEETHDSAR